jgi:hypothetical protein
MCLERGASRRLPRAGYGFKKSHYKDGLILSQSKIVSTEIRGIGLIFLPVLPDFYNPGQPAEMPEFWFSPPLIFQTL